MRLKFVYIAIGQGHKLLSSPSDEPHFSMEFIIKKNLRTPYSMHSICKMTDWIFGMKLKKNTHTIDRVRLTHLYAVQNLSDLFPFITTSFCFLLKSELRPFIDINFYYSHSVSLYFMDHFDFEQVWKLQRACVSHSKWKRKERERETITQ